MTPKRDHFSSEFSLKDLFSIRDRTLCERAIRNGGIAAMVLAGITALTYLRAVLDVDLVLIRPLTDREAAYAIDPLRSVDVVLPLVLGLLVFRRSRVAATVLLAYLVASTVIMWMHFRFLRDALQALVFFLFFLTAMRGTYRWHGMSKQAGTTTAGA